MRVGGSERLHTEPERDSIGGVLRRRLNNLASHGDRPADASSPAEASEAMPDAPHETPADEACLDLRTRPLPHMEPKQVAVVEDVTGDADDIARLKSMGLCAGRRLQLVKRGDPLVVRVLGSRIGISRRLAEHVVVRPCMLSGE